MKKFVAFLKRNWLKVVLCVVAFAAAATGTVLLVKNLNKEPFEFTTILTLEEIKEFTEDWKASMENPKVSEAKIEVNAGFPDQQSLVIYFHEPESTNVMTLTDPDGKEYRYSIGINQVKNEDTGEKQSRISVTRL
ncbi:hypothetical protein IJK16_02045 [Candidatus Saccharibacteria bacterium]|nr:hypothetical protein [Candidatus Saccharibacteria bacterium]